MLTKKHFIELARLLKDSKPHLPGMSEIEYLAAYRQWTDIQRIIAYFCLRQNDRFNMGRFDLACGIGE